MVKCILCTNKTIFLDKYKFNVKTDVKYFGNLKIFLCKRCSFAFCSPMPKKFKINSFYKNIYRSPGRPHEISENYNDELLTSRNLNYVQYLSTFINFDRINNILDFGSGTGDIAYILKKKFNHLNIFSFEKDRYAIKILKSRSYKIIKNINDTKYTFDLIIACHVLEHLDNLKIINLFKKISHKKTFLFFETPNNIFLNKFHLRPYDSPHLLFFSKKSFKIIEKKFKLKLIDINFASHSMEQNFLYMEVFKKKFGNWKEKHINITNKLKKLIKKIVPKKFIYVKDQIFKNKNNLLDNFILGKEDSWCIRGLYKVNKL